MLAILIILDIILLVSFSLSVIAFINGNYRPLHSSSRYSGKHIIRAANGY